MGLTTQDAARHAEMLANRVKKTHRKLHRRFDREGAGGNDVELHIECDPELAGQLVDKGSVTIDGVSLTVVKVVEDGFHVALIPHTLEVTTLSELTPGDPVNLEVDVFGKYVKQYLDRVLPGMVAAAR